MRDLLQQAEPPAVTEPVVMELLATRRPDVDVVRIRRHLLAFRMLRVGGLHTWEQAAVIQRACRSQGETVRSMIDCIIAAVAIREGATLLHLDADFDMIARHTPLRIEHAQ